MKRMCQLQRASSSASELDANGSTIYLQCRADTGLSSIEKLLRSQVLGAVDVEGKASVTGRRIDHRGSFLGRSVLSNDPIGRRRRTTDRCVPLL